MAMKANEERNARRRVKSRDNQRRYRQEYHDCIQKLQNEVQALEILIARCEGQISQLNKTLCWHEPEVNTVLEFRRLFKHSSYSAIPQLAHKQREFLTVVMHPDIIFMEQIGIKKVFEQYTLYHTLFHSFELNFQDLYVMMLDDNIVVRVRAKLHMRMSRRTIQALYPHILYNEGVVQKLIGRLLRLQMILNFHFNECSVIGELDTFADTTSNLIDLLKDIPTALIMANGGRVSHKAELKVSDMEICEL
ncbi:hypothetical protein THRCLA_03657 [Thraustotheca clavata]|uniref:BZIP domain-containing protein n=1 Tax=Thraustotheca clavata TaxID=74557 RepID=A0A1W0A1B6_9STRA|nr:hypothetical protein THRCLA_03657 [Thraustotheca clavata]